MMSAPPSAPVWRLVNGFATYWTLVAAIELGLFDALADAPRGDTELAAMLGARADRLSAVLNALAMGGLVAGPATGRALTEVASTYLVTTSPSYLGQLVVSSPGPLANWQSLGSTLSGGAPPVPISPDIERAMAAHAFPLQLLVARSFANEPPLAALADSIHVVDLGSRLGPWTVALLERRATGSAAMLVGGGARPAATETLDRHRLADRVALADDGVPLAAVPTADVIVLDHVCRTLEEAAVAALIGRCGQALRAGGVLIVSDYILHDADEQQDRAIAMSITTVANRGTRVFRHAEFERWINASGLDVVVSTAAGPGHVLIAKRRG